MLHICRKYKGTISVFLTLILIPTFIFGGVLVDGSRILGARNIVSGAGNLAMNGALSNYQSELNDTYGLLAMASTPEEVNDALQDFFEVSLNAAGVSHEDFNKALVYLELIDDSFNVSAVPQTQVYETEVLKQEILEYMKYRAPATLINREIIERLTKEDSPLKNVEKEKAAVEGELQFESELDDVQELMDSIKEQTDRLEEIYKQVEDEAGLNAMLSDAEKTYRDKITILAAAYARMTNCPDAVTGGAESLMKRMVDLSCDVGTINASNASAIIQMIMVHNGMSGIDPWDILDGIPEDSEEYEEKKDLIEDYEDACEVMAEGVENTGRQLDEAVADVYGKLNKQRKLAVEGEECCKKALEDLEKLQKEFEDLHGRYETWKSAVEALPEGESKEQYKNNISEVESFFESEGSIGGLDGKLKNDQEFYKQVWTQLDTVTFGGSRLDEDISRGSAVVDKARGYASGIKSESDIRNAAGSLMGEYVSTHMSVGENIDVSDDGLVKLLKEKYCKYEESNKAAADAAAENCEDALKDQTDQMEEMMESEDVADIDVNDIGQGDLPSNWLGISAYSGADTAGDIETEGGLKNKSDRKKMTESGSGNLNKDNGSISGISSLGDMISPGAALAAGAADIAERVYLTEYVVGMFSNYTTGQGDEEASTESLSGDDLTDNALYRAEVEYILWGSPHTRNNLAITKAILFTIHFIFNMTFAFTDASIKGWALGVAALFPCGPLAKTAIKCALQTLTATIQTVKDVKLLVEGKQVAPLKIGNTANWDTWPPAGLFGEGMEDTGFTLDYEDYLWVFLCIGMFTGAQKDMLARTADCIELNMTEGKSDNDNSLHEMSTMLELEADVSVNTFFIPKLSNEGYDVGTIDEDTFTIHYHGIQGY